MAIQLTIASKASRSLWVGETGPEEFAHRHSGLAHTVLGQEFDIVVLDAWSGLDVDDLGALVGVIRAGGLFILLCPDFEHWPDFPDPALNKMRIAGSRDEDMGHRYLKRLKNRLLGDSNVLIIRQDAPLPGLEPESDTTSESPPYQAELERTTDQVTVINSILQLMETDTPGALAMIADRGRGKSSALGMAAAELAANEVPGIVITAPRSSAVEMVFLHYEQLAPVDGPSLRFVAPDELIRNPVQADLLMVDEAAAIPVQVLARLLEHYPRVVFATTVHGYEGSGRGFEIRFTRILDRLRPGWKKVYMHQPVRWAMGDPLEEFAFRALMMDAQPATDVQLTGVSAELCRYTCINRDNLVEDEALLGELFGLLVTAHYRTRPFDLRYLMDASNVEIHALTYNGHFAAVAMLAREGGFDLPTSRAIYAGIRRPRGHLLAQSLSAHCGVEKAPVNQYARIVRIAVHPAFQGRGLGSRLLAEIESALQASGLAGIGTSFAADAPVLRFWQKRGFVTVHVGVKQEHTTGSFPLLMFKAQDDTGQQILDEARSRFGLRYTLLRQGLSSSMDVETLQLLDQATESPDEVVFDTQHEVLAFTYAHRGLELSLYALRSYLADWDGPSYERLLESVQKRLIDHCILHLTPLSEAAKLPGISGKREALQVIRSGFARLIEHESEPESLAYRDELLKLRGL